ncbi:hypothetical protein ACWGIU_06200 [Streptomyces sp. NPDC054840]
MKMHAKIHLRQNLRLPALRQVVTLTVSLSTTVAAMFALGGPGTASAAPAEPAHCPSSAKLDDYLTADNVGASFTVNGNTATYTFDSFVDENPVNAVPGLTNYCVYPGQGIQPDTITPLAVGANGAAWTGAQGKEAFSFRRPQGNPSNIPLDGNSTQVGTATWGGGAPTVQAILLRINDQDQCKALYGDKKGARDGHYSDKGANCFVKPAQPCATGSNAPGIVYTALPVGILKCPEVPSLGFEASATSEFGDEVGLSSTTGDLQSLRVLFQSFGCSDSGHWYSSDCVTTPGATFTHPLTANIYAVDNSGPVPAPGALLATVTQNFPINYRPSKDPVNCTGADAGRWYNPNNQTCVNSLSQLLTFNFPAGTSLPSQVIWTVAFNTTRYGSNPIGESAPCFSSNPGCGYDSLNVGARTFPGAPYAGTDVDPNGAFLNSTDGSTYCDGGTGGTGTLRLDTPCWTPFTPLGEITLT